MALKGLTFKVPSGECFVMLGSNGAGKTTLFKIMLSEIFPTRGEVYIKGKKLEAKNINKIRELIG